MAPIQESAIMVIMPLAMPPLGSPDDQSGEMKKDQLPQGSRRTLDVGRTLTRAMEIAFGIIAVLGDKMKRKGKEKDQGGPGENLG